MAFTAKSPLTGSVVSKVAGVIGATYLLVLLDSANPVGKIMCAHLFPHPDRNCCLKKNQNAPRPSEHPPVMGEKCQNVLLFLTFSALVANPKKTTFRGGQSRS